MERDGKGGNSRHQREGGVRDGEEEALLIHVAQYYITVVSASFTNSSKHQTS